MTEPQFGPGPNLLNLNLEVQVKVRDFLDRTLRFRFRFWLELSKPEPDRTIASLAMTDHLEQVLNKAWAPSTIETYGTGLMAYHTFCNHTGISEEDRAPAPQEVLAIFAATLAGVYATSTIANYIAGV
jgi:hypothetical protein